MLTLYNENIWYPFTGYQIFFFRYKNKQNQTKSNFILRVSILFSMDAINSKITESITSVVNEHFQAAVQTISALNKQFPDLDSSCNGSEWYGAPRLMLIRRVSRRSVRLPRELDLCRDTICLQRLNDRDCRTSNWRKSRHYGYRLWRKRRIKEAISSRIARNGSCMEGTYEEGRRSILIWQQMRMRDGWCELRRRRNWYSSCATRRSRRRSVQRRRPRREGCKWPWQRSSQFESNE